jgi:hypothetical protein
MPTATIRVARLMGTGTFSRPAGFANRLLLPLSGVAVVAIAVAACGASASGSFSWLHPLAPPAGWTVARIPGGAELPDPPGWRREHGDRGSATAALLGPDGRFLGYLNLTPRQGAETFADWPSFRVEHNREEGDRAVRRLSSATGLHFLDGRGSCVKDSYTTQTGSRFTEIACLVGGRAESVVVGAAPPARWSTMSGVLERAIDAVRT